MYGDLERVRSDLAIVKGLCAEPAVPREDIVAFLALAAGGAALAVAPWLVPLAWVKLGTVLAVALGAAVYLPGKIRLLKQQLPERAMEIKEYGIWSVAAIGMIGYVLYCRFVLEGGATFAEGSWGLEAGGLFVFLGLGLLAQGLMHRTRRPNLAMAAACVAVGLLLPFAPDVRTFLTFIGAAVTLGSLGTAAGMAWLVRSQRRSHAGD